jgi:hypothetical protein
VAATARRIVERQRRLEQVADSVVERADAIPALPHADEGLLHQVFRLGRVMRDEEECPEQPFALGLVDLLERERDPKALR